MRYDVVAFVLLPLRLVAAAASPLLMSVSEPVAVVAAVQQRRQQLVDAVVDWDNLPQNCHHSLQPQCQLLWVQIALVERHQRV